MIPFNKPYIAGREFDYMRDAASAGVLAGNGQFTKRCHTALVEAFGSRSALLTQSCTAALEMAALLADLSPGDEVIMPSYTFVSTANAFVLRGAVPVFVDVRPDTLNLDERLVEAAITKRTRVIVPVHYAGVPCQMDVLMDIADRHGLLVVEDAAQAFGSTWRRRPAGSFGHLAALSFHETKNIIAGEGGALLINDERFVERAEILWEKGTNRTRFRRGEVNKYTWVDVGSSFLPSELTAAFLYAQLEQADHIQAGRMAIWQDYERQCATVPSVRGPVIPPESRQNAHMFYVLLPHGVDRAAVIQNLMTRGVHAVFHYVPLHSSPAGRRFGRANGTLPVTDDVSSRVIRLPLWMGMTPDHVATVTNALKDVISAHVVSAPA
jgi:dTDP-4-amino-4,6-dideoxygalactose transaminase